MSETHTFETIERHQKSDKSGYHVFRNAPNHQYPVYPAQAEFIFKASEVLTQFRKDWIASHPDGWANGLEMDLIPVLTNNMVMGYMVISEIDGESYDYVPSLLLKNEEKTE